jgi:hypothetical protein
MRKRNLLENNLVSIYFKNYGVESVREAKLGIPRLVLELGLETL